MTGKTTIEWTDQPGYRGAVWNPTTGCTRVSAGCDNCYAFALHDKRYAGNLKAARDWLADRPDAVKLAQDSKQSAQATVRFITRDDRSVLPWPKQYDLPFSRVQLLEDRLDVPLRTRTPTCYFVDSMSDLFHEDVPDEYIAQVFAVMAIARRHRFLILTKRPERMRAFADGAAVELPPLWMKDRLRYVEGEDLGRMMAGQPAYTWPYPNVWLGTSVEDQRSADERIPHLLATPAAVRFLSCEPLLGPVALTSRLLGLNIYGHSGAPCCLERVGYHWLGEGLVPERPKSPIDWVIVGGESGPRARPMDLAWARSLVDQCRAAGVAPFVKQLGKTPFDLDASVPIYATVRESHGRDMAEWPEDLRIREFPGVGLLG